MPLTNHPDNRRLLMLPPATVRRRRKIERVIAREQTFEVAESERRDPWPEPLAPVLDDALALIAE